MSLNDTPRRTRIVVSCPEATALPSSCKHEVVRTAPGMETDYLLWLAPDRELLPGGLDALVEAAEKHPYAAELRGCSYLLEAGVSPVREKMASQWPAGGSVEPGVRLFRANSPFEGAEQGCVELKQLFSIRWTEGPGRVRWRKADLEPWGRRVRFWREYLWLLAYRVVTRWFEGAAFPERPTAAREARPMDEPTIEPKRIGYFLWQYPKLSETFIRREVAALRESGIKVVVLAHESDPECQIDPWASAEIPTTQYLLPMSRPRLARLALRFCREQPLVCARLLAFLIGCQHRGTKTWADDLRVWRLALLLAGAARDQGLEHLHSPWGNECALVARVAARLVGVPFSVQVRAADLHRQGGGRLLETLLPGAAAVVTNTRYNARFVAPLRGKEDVYLIANGLDLQRFPRLGRVHRAFTPAAAGAPYRILAVGRLVEFKGFHFLLEACQLLRERGVDFECTILGGADPLYVAYRVSLLRLWKRLGLEDCVRFAGSLAMDDIRAAYRFSDVFVLPAIVAADGARDIIPNVVLEAMAMELPVIATRIGGIPEMIEDGSSGILLSGFSPGEPDFEDLARRPRVIADALERLLHDPALRARLGTAARDRIEQHFAVDRQARQLLEMFRSCGRGSPLEGGGGGCP